MIEPINPARDAIENTLRGRPCPCCRRVSRGKGPDQDQAECPCRWWWNPWAQDWCRQCGYCLATHCTCQKGMYDY